MILMTRSNAVIEVEIKVWRGDWLHELSTIELVQSEACPCTNALDPGRESRSAVFALQRRRASTAKWNKHTQLARAVLGNGIGRGVNVPNYYYVAALTGVVRDEDMPRIPGYIGIIEIKRTCQDLTRSVLVKREAKRIHFGKSTPAIMLKLARGIQFRYWAGRVNVR